MCSQDRPDIATLIVTHVQQYYQFVYTHHNVPAVEGTQINLLHDWLVKLWLRSVCFKEIGKVPTQNEVRDAYKCLHALFKAKQEKWDNI